MLVLNPFWNDSLIKTLERMLSLAMLSDEHSLAVYAKDFGRLLHSAPKGIFKVENLIQLQKIFQFASTHNLPLTIRGEGLGQGGQSLATKDSVLIQKNFSQPPELVHDAIWVDGTCSWIDLIKHSLPHKMIPRVIPYNTNLNVAGVLSAGGFGAASFQFGSAASNVLELEIVHTNGELELCKNDSQIGQSCLGGQGLFGFINRIKIPLRPCKSLVRSFFISYGDKDIWLNDLQKISKIADHIESFCSPAIMGARINPHGRTPFAQWLYGLQIAIEYESEAPQFDDLNLGSAKLLLIQDESIATFLTRHNARIQLMQGSVMWELTHPWYECLVKKSQLEDLECLLDMLPINFAPIVHVMPVKPEKYSGFVMYPDGDDIFLLMILPPGIDEAFSANCIELIAQLDSLLLAKGGKRYLSGYLGNSVDINYWQHHFDTHFKAWRTNKSLYDPKNILTSVLHP